MVVTFINLPSSFNSSSYPRSGCHLTSSTSTIWLFSLFSLPVTCSIIFSRSSQVNAFLFLSSSRSSATYPELPHFPLHELTSMVARPVCLKTEEPEVSSLLPYNPLLSLTFFFFPLHLYQSVKSTSSFSLN